MTALPEPWLAALQSLRPAPLPVGEPPPLDLTAALAALQPGVSTALGWDALHAQARQEPLPDTARRWGRTQESVRQTLNKAARQVRWAATTQPAGRLLQTWAEQLVCPPKTGREKVETQARPQP